MFQLNKNEKTEVVTNCDHLPFDPNLHKALRLKVVETSRSVSELVNEAVRETLSDDAEDLLAFEERADETLISYEDFFQKVC